MPYVCVRTTQPVTAEKMDLLQREIGRLITLIPGKTVDNCMTQIEGGGHIFMGGGPANAVFCEVRLFGAAPAESKAAFYEALHPLLQQQLGAEKIYVNFMEFSEWASGGQYKTV